MGNTTTKPVHPLSALAKTELVCQHARVMSALWPLISLMCVAAAATLLLPWVARCLSGLGQKSAEEGCGEPSAADGFHADDDGGEGGPRGFDGILHGIVWLVWQPVLVCLLLLAVSSRPLGSRAAWFWLVLMIPPCLGVLYSWRKLNRVVSHSDDR